MSYKTPTACPVCANTLNITKLECPNCKTELLGRFAPCAYCTLNEKQQFFLETFLRCRGSLKDVGSALSLSYPTVKGLLDELLFALNLNDCSTQAQTTAGEILKRVKNKELTPSEAAALITKIKGD